jgi:hypothetical protein
VRTHQLLLLPCRWLLEDYAGVAALLGRFLGGGRHLYGAGLDGRKQVVVVVVVVVVRKKFRKIKAQAKLLIEREREMQLFKVTVLSQKGCSY